MFDACFNGSFHTEDFISGAYVFGNGRTISAQANTVNSIQDKFPDEMIGLLSYGIRIGEWNRMVCFLETHIIGDPTFRFASSDPKLNAEKMADSEKNNARLLKLVSYPHPDVQSWALWHLAENGYDRISELLVEKYFSSPYGVVRMAALKALSKIRDDNFVRVTGAALDDSYELVRRFGAVYCQESGDPRLAQYLIKAVTDPNISKRVNYQALDALSFFDRDLLLDEVNKRFAGVDTANHMGTIRRETIDEINKRTKSCTQTVTSVIAPDATEKEKIFEIRRLRNATYHPAIVPLCDYLLTAPGEKIEIELLEALGWFNYSYNRQVIIEICSRIISEKEKFSENARSEALRTINRVK